MIHDLPAPCVYELWTRCKLGERCEFIVTPGVRSSLRATLMSRCDHSHADVSGESPITVTTACPTITSRVSCAW